MPTTVSSSLLPKITFYRYIGKKDLIQHIQQMEELVYQLQVLEQY